MNSVRVGFQNWIQIYIYLMIIFECQILNYDIILLFMQHISRRILSELKQTEIHWDKDVLRELNGICIESNKINTIKT